MKILDALNILGIKKVKDLSKKEVKTAFHRACLKYHPDHNPTGLKIMQMVLQAWETLQKANFPIDCEEEINQTDLYDYGEEINAALNKIIKMTGIVIEVCGSWVWVSATKYEDRTFFCPPRKFDPKTKKNIPDDEIRFKWSRDKKCWYFHPRTQFSRKYGQNPFSMDKIKDKFGATTIKTKNTFQLST